MRVKTGLDLFESRWPRALSGARVGLLVHPASVNNRLAHAPGLFMRSKKCRLSALLGPQHGIYGQTQDNMIEWSGFKDGATDLPVFSLYGKQRKPTSAMLREMDALVIDLQDVGARYYTFIWTMDLCMEACAEEGKPLVVLDRPNPVGGRAVEGTVLDPECSSFVGLRPLPARHGMTIAEVALYLRDAFHQSADLHIIRMEGWSRRTWFDGCGLPWVLPSPNMPSPDTALVYPGMCLLEGTCLSEGRGTTRPFEIFGAPFIKDPERLVKRLSGFRLPGVVMRPLYFEPTFQKHAGTLCGGAQIHVTDRERFKPFKTAAAILKAIREFYSKIRIWKKPPYEYEEIKLPIDILAGTPEFRLQIDRGTALDVMEEQWKEQCRAFNRTMRKRFLLYE